MTIYASGSNLDDCQEATTDSCAGNHQVFLELKFDNWPVETSWQLTDSIGGILYSGENYSEIGGLQRDTLCLAAGCYELTVFDEEGDGMCCVYGDGSYLLTNENGDTLCSGGEFGEVITHEFCVDDLPEPSCTDGILNGQETGIDCGGPNCPPCGSGGCENGDTGPPIARCLNTLNLSLDELGEAELSAADVDNGSTDDCELVGLTINVNTFSCNDQGANPVTLTATDGSGNVATCQTIVNVLDDTPPAAICHSETFIHVDAAGLAEIAASDIDNGTTDNCQLSSLTIDRASFSCTEPANVPVTLTATDGSGNVATCQTDVIVLDTIPPVAVCQNLTISLTTTDTTLTPEMLGGNSTDNCDSLILSINKSEFSCEDHGTIQIVEVTATDASGNTNICTAAVSIEDNQPPSVVCPPDVTLVLDASGSVSLGEAGDINATDNCPGPTGLIPIISPRSEFDCADAGSTIPITISVTDAAGNSNTCHVEVSVLDDSPPLALCRDDFELALGQGGFVYVSPSDIDAGSSDNCGLGSFSLNIDTLTCEDAGLQEAVLTVTDLSGNTASCTTAVTVIDTLPLDIICPDGVVSIPLDANGNASIEEGALNISVVSSCLAETSITPTSFSCDDIGQGAIKARVTDESGRTDSCIITIEVADTTPPSVDCNDVTVAIGPSGKAPVSLFDLVNLSGISDNCGLDFFVIKIPLYTCDDLGVNTVEVKGFDESFNEGLCISEVTVVEDILSESRCRDVSIALDASGSAMIVPSSVISGNPSSLSCDGNISLTVSPNEFDCDDIGSNQVLISALSGTELRDTCSVTVTVEDLTPPIAICKSGSLCLDANGTVTLNADFLNGGSNDNCQGALNYLADQTSFDCDDLGVQDVELTVTDESGNSSTCLSALTINDCTDPVATCQDVTVSIGEGGSVSPDPALIYSGNPQDCGGVLTYTLVPGTFNCSNLGANDVTLEVADPSGNTASCEATVTVEDPTDYCATEACPETLHLGPDPIPSGLYQAAASVLASGPLAAGADVTMTGGQSVKLLPGFSAGAGTLLLARIQNCTTETTDSEGPPLVTTRTDTDSPQPEEHSHIPPISERAISTPPVPVCTDVTVSLDSDGQFSLEPDALIVSITGGTGPVNPIDAPFQFDCDDIGAQTVTVTVADELGVTGSCEASVSVIDDTPPELVCNDVTLVLPEGREATLLLADVFDQQNSTDNCEIAFFVLSQLFFDCSNLGSNTLQFVAYDESGNAGSCESEVTVVEDFLNETTCADVVVGLDTAGQAVLEAAAILTNDLSDWSCDYPLDFSLSRSDFSCADVGQQYVVGLTASVNGQFKDTCSVTVSVIDSGAPTARCSDGTTCLMENGTAVVDPQTLDAGSTDACPGQLTFELSQTQFSCADRGANSLILTVTDESGNTSTCASELTILDCTPPEVVCMDITAALGPSGSVTPDAALAGAGSSDICDSSLVFSMSPQTFSCSDLGIQDATLQVSDASGNASSCAITVTVTDPAQHCGGPCQTQLELGPATIESGLYRASQTISANAPIEDQGDVTLLAGQAIILQPGFSVSAGGALMAQIEACAAGETAVILDEVPEQPSAGSVSDDRAGSNRAPHSHSRSQLSSAVYPNPFNNQLTVELSLPQAGEVTIWVSTVQGALLTEVLPHRLLEAGFHRISFDGTGFPPGVYVLMLEAMGQKLPHKILKIN